MHSIKKIFFVMPFALCLMNMQCNDDDNVEIPNEVCDETTIINQDLYDNLNSAHFTFLKSQIIDDCLSIEFGSSGCDGNTWDFKLVDSGAIAESSPEQRYLKFQLINDELCDAYFERSVSFDLTPLQINGSNEIILHIEDFKSSLNYKY